MVEKLSIDGRSSTWPGWSGSPVRRSRSRPSCAATSASRWPCRSPSAWPRRGCSPRSRAVRRSPTACSWCRPTPSWSSSTRCQSSDSGASARRPPASSTLAASRRSATPPSCPSPPSFSCSGRPRAGACLRFRTTMTRGPCAGGARGVRSARSRPATTPPAPRGDRRRTRPPGRPRHAADADHRADGPHGCSASALRRLLAGEPVAHPRAPDGRHASGPRDGPGAARRHHAGDRAEGPHARRHHGEQPRTRRRARAARAAVDDPTGPALDAVLDGVRDRFGSAAVSRATSLGQKESPSPVETVPPRSTLE